MPLDLVHNFTPFSQGAHPFVPTASYHHTVVPPSLFYIFVLLSVSDVLDLQVTFRRRPYIVLVKCEFSNVEYICIAII